MNKLTLTILLLLFCNTVFADIFKKIEVKGNDRIDKKVIIEYSKLKVNINYAESDLNEAQKNIYKTGFFKDNQLANAMIKLEINNLEMKISIFKKMPY